MNYCESEPFCEETREERDLFEAQVSALTARAEQAEAEVERLRTALIQTGNNLGAALSDQVSTDFLVHVPEEACLRIARLTMERDDAREQRHKWQEASAAGRAEVERLREALLACADDLEASVNAEYAGTMQYPSQARKHERDMAPVKNARDLLRAFQQRMQQEKP